MDYILADPTDIRDNLMPMTYTRPVSELRVGILTLREKWQKFLPGSYSYITADYLSELFPGPAPDGCKSDEAITLSADIIPDAALADAVASLSPGQALYASDSNLIASRGNAVERIIYPGTAKRLRGLTDIFTMNADEITADFRLLTAGRKSAPLSPTVTVVGDPSLVFLDENAVAECCFINVNGGPVYIGPDAEVMEASALRGPIAVCRHSTVNMGSKIYGGTTVGPWSKVGGELNNVVIHSYSNKAHDGFLGNAVIGSWCNIGAGCVASNLKNDYTEVKLWNYPAHRFLRTGLQFCGLIMGDHSKAGINTMFNTATVIGVGVNIHGTGFQRNFVASFSEGGTAGFSDVPMSNFFDVAERVMARRGLTLTDADRRMFFAIREIADNYK